MLVMKFGGSSVANATSIRRVFNIVSKLKSKSAIIVVSALGGTTDHLKELGQLALQGNDISKSLNDLKLRHLTTSEELLSRKEQVLESKLEQYFSEIKDLCKGIQLLKEITHKTEAALMSYGEILSSTIIHYVFKDWNLPIAFKDSRKLIVTDSNYLIAKVDFDATNKKITAEFNKSSEISIVPGFVAQSAKGELTTLGRGGSDYTAAIFAAATNAEQLDIWSDVNGILTADPRKVKDAFTIEELSYNEAMELSHFGAKVIYPPTIQPVLEKEIPIFIKNTMEEEAVSSRISTNTSSKQSRIAGVSSLDQMALINLSGIGMIGVSGYAERFFSSFAKAGVNISFITQSCSEQSICVGVRKDDLNNAIKQLNLDFELDIKRGLVDPIENEEDLSIVALVGENMKNQPGICGNAMMALGENGISVKAIAQGSSELNISLVIPTVDENKALNVLHEKFFSKDLKTVHLFVAGVGNVGAEFLQIIDKQNDWLKKHHNLNIKIAGAMNSKTMLIDENGIKLDNWKDELTNSIATSNILDFVKQIKSKNLRNSIFIDNTASENISEAYESLLRNSIAIVTCNKLACSDNQKRYQTLKHLAKENNVQFKYETNVGAALPIISTINDLNKSGDKISNIKAVLSGSLNFIFNTFDGNQKFVDVVKQAQQEGYTEPDPSIDLSGKDVARKILILAREAGFELEFEDVNCKSFLPTSCQIEGNADRLFEELNNADDYFQNIYQKAKNANKKLRIVAEFDGKKANVGLQEIDEQSPLYHISGKDNLVMLYTYRYEDQPLVIKGAGAGAAVTAAGVFSDVMRIINKD